MAKRNVESSWEYDPDEAEVYLLDLLSHREISNEIANYSGVKHESPQLILLKNKLAVHHASHSDINTENLRQFLNRTV
jgi:bacillithiol system protein YtxJ